MASKKITKIDIVDSIYGNTNIDKKTVQVVVDNFLEQIKSSLKDSATIEFRGFGTFENRLRKGKSYARNPRNGETVVVPPHYVVVFRAGKELKNSVRNILDTQE